MSKPFDKKLYDENNDLAINVVKSYLLSTGLYGLYQRPLEEMYKEGDYYMVLLSTGQRVLIEVERKVVWDSDSFFKKFNTVHIPYRKKDSKSQIFAMVNKSCNQIAITHMSKVLSSPVVSKNTKYTENEKFFEVNLDQFKFTSCLWL